METYFYTAVDQEGKKQEGSLESDSEKLVRQKLREKNLIPISVNALENKTVTSTSYTGSQRLSNKELSLITQQIALLLKSGIPLAEVLNLLSKQTNSKKVQAITLKLRKRLMEGQSLSQAIDQLGNTFPPLFRATVKAGESSGKLGEVFNYLADYFKDKANVRQKIKLSLLYPIILTIISIAVIISLLLFVIPEIVVVFEDMGQTLPDLTILLISLSEFIQNHGIGLLLMIIVVTLVFNFLLKITFFKLALDTFILKAPYIGNFVAMLNTSLFIRTLAILSASKVETMNALLIASEVLSNTFLKNAVKSASQQVREGSSISKALINEKCFPEITTDLISSGESSGRLAEMLDSTAAYHEQEIQNMTRTLVALFEPLLILFMGTVVLMIVIAILLPIFEMNQLIG